ncbi:hypothetical protein [Synechococcus sp. BA-132 BA5]|uniref:hypothetical protein n=1 Tax=Synechococcus sp. BA-132 BA5 TaxID=3110252 RepID=UPI002B2070F0|nr:hypothetical protein [Synechococcus sp. BA-132 BA5]MEA5416259.1 hypothetical protein [Synechococcus sp. BA-132 BA5]
MSAVIRLDGHPQPVIDWRTCSPAPMAWIPQRELLLSLVHTPVLLLPLAAALGLALALVVAAAPVGTAALALLLPLALRAIYTPPVGLCVG